ncbi:MAG: helix-turn-helix transcriptional regulator, partial [Oscillospiraceae bacterium]|nr:helix-turn-helix transcriptional regulator [Oscillospiraceae bacterium]
MEYSQKILDFMDSHGVSAYKLAKDLKISESTFSKWRSKPTSDISIQTVNKIAAYFNVTVETLIGPLDQKEKSPSQLNDEDLKVFDAFKRLAPEQQRLIRDL